MCDRQCRKKGFNYCNIASVLAADNGELHTKKPLQIEASRKGGASYEQGALKASSRCKEITRQGWRLASVHAVLRRSSWRFTRGAAEATSPLPCIMARSAIKAGRADDGSELMNSDELNPWMMAKLKESYYQAKQDDDQRKSSVQQMMQKSTDFPRRIIVPVVQDREGSHCRTCAHTVTDTRWKTTSGVSR